MAVTLGLDLSIGNSGYAILDKGILIESDTIPTAHLKTRDTRIRLNYITKEIKLLIKKYKPNKIIIEDVFSGKNRKTTNLLCKLQGAVLVSIPNKYKVTVIAATSARKRVLGEGIKHTKDDVKLWAISKYKLPADTKDDITDAILLANC